MTKFKRKLIATIFSVFSLLCLTVGLTACGEATLKEIHAQNYRTLFKVGDAFETGDGFTVTALYSDGSTKDVTSEATIRHERGFDMNVAGDYQVTVSYERKKDVYVIYVDDFNNVLKSLSVDASAAKTQYNLGDTISYEGLKITATYENAQGSLIERPVASIGDCTVKITDAAGATKGTLFTAMGKHTVTLSMGEVSASYEVNVTGMNLSSVGGAVGVAGYLKSNVKSGTLVLREGGTGVVPTSGTLPSLTYEYEFGNDFTYGKQKEGGAGDGKEFFYADNNGKTFLVTKEDGHFGSEIARSDAGNGAPCRVWSAEYAVYGAEELLENLYGIGKDNPNGDLQEMANEGAGIYKFSYSMLRHRGGVNYFFSTEVEFTLGADHALSSAKVSQKSYGGDYTVDANGKATPSATHSSMFVAEFTQVSGTRDRENPYSPAKMIAQSFVLKHNGVAVDESTPIACKAGDVVYLNIADVLPATASFDVDRMYVSDGDITEDSAGSGMRNDAMYAYRSGDNLLQVSLFHGGVHTLYVQTENVRITVKFNVRGAAPTSMTAQAYSSAFNRFVDASACTVFIGATVYLRAEPNQHAYGEFTAVITQGTATLVQTTINTSKGEVTCYAFTADTAGTYVVTMASAEATAIKTAFTVTVMAKPDFSSMLAGIYTVTDAMETRYQFSFTQSSSTSGTLMVLKTEEGGAQAMDMLTYAVDEDEVKINLTRTQPDGTDLGIHLEIRESDGALIFRDAYGDRYVMQRS